MQVYNIDQWPDMQHKRAMRENAWQQYHKERAAAKAQRAERRGGGKGSCFGCFGSGGGLGLPVQRPMTDGEAGGEAQAIEEAALPGDGSGKAGLAAASNGQLGAAGAAQRRHRWGAAGWGCCGGQQHAPGQASGSGSEEDEGAGEVSLSQRRLERQSSVRFSPAYHSYLAWKVDRIAFVVLLVAYCLAIILIFVLQHGPVQLEGY